MNVFRLRQRLIEDYSAYVGSFIEIHDPRIRDRVQEELNGGLLWPEPLIQLNPSFASGGSIEDLVDQGVLHPECRRIFRAGKEKGDGRVLRLYQHQVEAIGAARSGHNYVLTTGTGSGKSLAYIVPIVDHVLRQGRTGRIQAIVVYPMNALANSQLGELQKFLCLGYPDGKGSVTFARYTGQERDEERQEVIKNPPDILLTNYVMLELLLTRPYEQQLIAAAQGLRFLVLDELHTYRGRQGADVAMLVRRTRETLNARELQCIGTSATLASAGSFEQQRADVSHVAAVLFGAPVQPDHVIGETLERATPDHRIDEPAFVSALRNRIQDETLHPAADFRGFVDDPVSTWVETTFGITRDAESGRLIRVQPRSIRGDQGAARVLSDLTGVPDSRCAAAIEEQLLASYGAEPNPANGFPVFAFRLHQFISRGDTVYATIEPEADRYITLQGQQFVPGDRTRVLLPLVFCRECGQEYYCVRAEQASDSAGKQYAQRQLNDRTASDTSESGFLFVNTTDPWPDGGVALQERLPEDWLEEFKGSLRVRRDRREWLPRRVLVQPDGTEGGGIACEFVPAPFRFCLRCGVAYGFRQVSDFGKLAVLGTEGRSTATTVLSLAVIRSLLGDTQLEPQARKLLSFTDNRQDASLQAGHFNDFVEIGLLRSAVYGAVAQAGPAGVRHEELTQRVFEALDLPLDLYAADPSVRFQQLEDTKRALRAVLGYRLYRDLQRGWRITSPNLEQCGLLEIEYLSLDELCASEDVWAQRHPALATATPAIRGMVAKTLLDQMRRELTIKVDFLELGFQERMQLQSSQRLKVPWALDDSEQLEHASVLYPRSRREKDYRGHVFLSPRGGFGQYLRRTSTFPDLDGRLTTQDVEQVCRDLLDALREAGLVEVVDAPKAKDDVPGYQLPASAILWKAGDGSRAFHDPIRVPRVPDAGGRTNPFFIVYYQHIAAEGKGLEAREHTAQVPYDIRMEREDALSDRGATHPVLLAHHGAGRRHCAVERRQPAQHPADARQLRAAQRTRRAQRPACRRVLVLFDLQLARPVLLPSPASHGGGRGHPAAARSRQRRSGPRSRSRHLARRDRTGPRHVPARGARPLGRGPAASAAGARA